MSTPHYSPDIVDVPVIRNPQVVDQADDIVYSHWSEPHKIPSHLFSTLISDGYRIQSPSSNLETNLFSTVDLSTDLHIGSSQISDSGTFSEFTSDFDVWPDSVSPAGPVNLGVSAIECSPSKQVSLDTTITPVFTSLSLPSVEVDTENPDVVHSDFERAHISLHSHPTGYYSAHVLPSEYDNSGSNESTQYSVVPDNGLPRMIPVPQLEYKSKSKQRNVTIYPPIFFNVHERAGIPLKDALDRMYTGLHGRDDPMFESFRSSVIIRILWPGCKPRSQQIKTRNGCQPPQAIKKSKLATEIAKFLELFIKDMEGQSIGGPESNSDWGVGEGCITVDKLVLIALDHCSKSSWQPRLALLS